MDPQLIETASQIATQVSPEAATAYTSAMSNVAPAQLIAKGLATTSLFGAAIGEGYLIGKALEAMGRNPEMSGELFTRMIIGVAMAESSAIYALVLFFLI